MLAISTTLAAAAYLLIGQPGHTGPAVPVQLHPPCQLTMNMDPAPPARGNHISVRWVGSHHHRHHRR